MKKHFQGVQLQRCQVHFMRNFIAKLAKSEQQEALRLLKDVFLAHTKEDANERLEKVTFINLIAQFYFYVFHYHLSAFLDKKYDSEWFYARSARLNTRKLKMLSQ